jgi:tetratricopeptide (TPR) repeat protein
MRGGVWSDLGDTTKALADLDEAIRLDPASGVSWSNRGLVRARRGDLDGALADCEEAVRLTPTDAVALNNRGWVQRLRRQYAAAVADYEAAIKCDPKHPNAYKNLAWLRATCEEEHYRDGRLAVELATNAWELAGDANPAWVEIVAAAHAQVGDFDAAVEWQERWRERCPSEQRAAQAERVTTYRAGRAYRERLA